MNEHKNGPLNGLLVVDFTMFVSGPSCTQLLRDNGAYQLMPELGTKPRVYFLPPKNRLFPFEPSTD